MTSLTYGGVAALGLLALPLAGVARPITYPGGWDVMAGHEPTRDMLHANYTLNPRWAVGWETTHDREGDFTINGPKVTRGWRWNQRDSQANVYAWAGAGVATVDDNPRGATWGGASADWENRRWLALASMEGVNVANGPARFNQKMRLGVAPYIAEAGQLHTWAMLQVEHTPGMHDTWAVMPMVRQFWRDNLWEIGVSSRGGVLVNLMKTF